MFVTETIHKHWKLFGFISIRYSYDVYEFVPKSNFSEETSENQKTQLKKSSEMLQASRKEHKENEMLTKLSMEAI